MKPSLCHHFATMAYNNAWSSHRLLKACARLSQEELVAPRVSFFPSIKSTLNHNLTVDWFYVDALERGLRGQEPNTAACDFFDPEEPFATCAELGVEQRAVDRRLVDLCVALTEAQLEVQVAVQRRSGMDHDPAARLLAHLFQHQIHHRGQVHAMLAGTPVSPPQLDEFFCTNEAHLRAADLAEIGYSEEMIWGARI